MVVKPNGDKIRDKTTDSLIRDTLDARMCTLVGEGVERRPALSFLPVSSQLSMHVLYIQKDAWMEVSMCSSSTHLIPGW